MTMNECSLFISLFLIRRAQSFINSYRQATNQNEKVVVDISSHNLLDARGATSDRTYMFDSSLSFPSLPPLLVRVRRSQYIQCFLH
jgi:hypothetical protein